MVRVADWLLECIWMAAQAAGSGGQTQEAACLEVSSGSLLVLETHRGSMGAMDMRSPLERALTDGDLSAKEMTIFHEVAAGSRQMKVGGVMPGGKMEPSSG